MTEGGREMVGGGGGGGRKGEKNGRGRRERLRNGGWDDKGRGEEQDSV